MISGMRKHGLLRPVALFFAAAWIAVAILTYTGACPLGDDLGYCFADSRLHGADGPRVTDLSRIIATQARHYVSWNGRVIVHALVQLMLMPRMDLAYATLNGLAFALLWLGMCRLVAGNPAFSWRTAACVMALLWWLMPAPGVIWLSLRAFAVNYLWPGALCVWLLYYIRRILDRTPLRLAPLLFLALLCGALQESFSLPLIGTVLLLWLVRRDFRLLAVAAALSAGALVLILAPGNYAHARMGGGFSPEAIAVKASAMLDNLLLTPVLLPLLLYLPAAFIRKWRRLLRPGVLELGLGAFILFALLLGCMSFTSLRQLEAPSLVACALIGIAGLRICSRLSRPLANLLSVSALTLTAILLAGGFILRSDSARRYASVVAGVKEGRPVVMVDCSRAAYNLPAGAWPFSRLVAEPFDDGLLHIVFDPNTRRGLCRLHAPEGIRDVVIAPATLGDLRRFRDLSLEAVSQGVGRRVDIDSRYSLVALPGFGSVPKIAGIGKNRNPHRVAISVDGTIVLVMPHNTQLKLANSGICL